MSKIIVFDKQAKESLQEGIKKVAKAVKATMGPSGRNVLIEDPQGNVTSTKDGVSVAKIIELPDAIENIAATVIKQAAQKTVDKAGDGTTTSTVLAEAIALRALEATLDPKVNVTQLKKGIEASIIEVVEELQKLSKDITDESQLKQIATLSANGDEIIGELVAQAMDKVGRDGIISVEESRTGETSLEIVEGLQFDRGYKSPYFVTDNNTMNAVMKDTSILLIDGKISNAKELLPILEPFASNNKSIVIIAEDIEGELLGTLVMNKQRGALKVVAVKAPDFGDRRLLMLEDIAILTGGRVFSYTKGDKWLHFEESWFGKAKTVTVGRDTTTIVDGDGDPEEIKQRVLELKDQLDAATLPFEIEKLQERLGKMVGGVALINIGGVNEMEMKEKKDRLDDALQATKAAVEEGVLPGCGVALLTARTKIDLSGKKVTKDFLAGKQIVFDACAAPFTTILSNAGIESKEYTGKKNQVPDLTSDEGKYVDAYKSGIIDPTKVVRLALENAAGASTTLLLTECVIHENPEDKSSVDPMAAMMGM